MGGVIIVRIMYGVPTGKMITRVGNSFDGYLGAIINSVGAVIVVSHAIGITQYFHVAVALNLEGEGGLLGEVSRNGSVRIDRDILVNRHVAVQIRLVVPVLHIVVSGRCGSDRYLSAGINAVNVGIVGGKDVEGYGIAAAASTGAIAVAIVGESTLGEIVCAIVLVYIRGLFIRV